MLYHHFITKNHLGYFSHRDIECNNSTKDLLHSLYNAYNDLFFCIISTSIPPTQTVIISITIGLILLWKRKCYTERL